MLEFDGATKRFGDLVALNDCTFAARPGRLTGFLGPNGAGKTTARGAVIAWAIVWFTLGYLLYATIFGALGSLASRMEDAQSVAGPVQVVLIAAYFVSFGTIGSPHARWAMPSAASPQSKRRSP